MRHFFKPLLAATLTAALFFSCKENKNDMSETQVNHGIDLHYMDKDVSPKQDFYNFVNGTWMKETEIPDDHKSWGSFYILRKNTDENMLALLKEAMENNKFKAGSDEAKAVMLYNSKLDMETRDKAGLQPLEKALQQIGSINDLRSLQNVLTENPVEIANPFFAIYASPLFENSRLNGVYMYPGSLGLPDRDYYTNDDAESVKIREQYTDHISRMLQYLGEGKNTSRDKAQTVLRLETALAVPRLTKENRRDATKLNNPKSIGELTNIAPSVNWAEWINNMPVKKEIETIIVTQPEYIEALNGFLTSENIEDIKTLLVWQTLNGAAGSLTGELELADWEFFDKTLNGTPEQRPEEERALGTVNGTMGEALGKIYVDKYFPAEAKKTAEEMVQNVIETYEERINNLEWMTDETKVKAIEKLKTLVVKIGYPNEWKDYSEMDIKEGNSYYENRVAASKWRLMENLNKINEPVDLAEWHMSPQTVNAYYSPSVNQIVFPAAILQPPFFDYQADPAVNFGGIGAVIGHEISHAFDDSGSRFDADGNLNNWWTEEDLEKFKERTQKLVDFYSKIQVEDDLNLNGQFTLGENTADLGGVLSAYYGLQRYYESHKKPDEIDGLTQEQRFFMSWATVWRTKTRPEALRSQISTDPHAPGLYRAYLPLQNVDAFYDAFNISEGDQMYVAPEDRVRIW